MNTQKALDRFEECCNESNKKNYPESVQHANYIDLKWELIDILSRLKFVLPDLYEETIKRLGG